MIVAFLIFLVISTAIVLLQSFIFGYGLNMDMTISRYVGLSYWSAIIFFFANLAIAVLWVRRARTIHKSLPMSKLWFAFGVLGAIMLIALSLCPMGLFDQVPGEYGVVSNLHRFSSSSMFVCMVITAIGLAVKVKNKYFKLYSATYALYGIVCAVLFLTNNPWFWANCLPFESVFLSAYLLMFCLVPTPPAEPDQPDVL